MTLIMLTWLSTLFVHPPHPQPTSAARIHSCGSIVTLAVDRSRELPNSLMDTMLGETAAIWKPLGVEVRWDAPPAAEPPTTVLHVIILDEPSQEGGSRERLGWIRFMAPNEPETIVTLSRSAALQLLDSTPTLRQRPAQYRDLLLSRIMGRALAHELGHYLLASSAHASSGLMRANLPVDALIANDRAALFLEGPRGTSRAVSMSPLEDPRIDD